MEDPAGLDRTLLSVVVPIYDERETLPELGRRLVGAVARLGFDAEEFILVSDGSRDGSEGIIRGMVARDPRFRGVFLSRNFGHQAALSVGLACARGEYIGVMDCDMQDPVEVLLELFRACVRDDLDVCYGIRSKREAPLLLRAAYSIFYRIINKTASHEWPRDVGDFCVMSARCQRTLLALPEQSRMLRGLRSWIGFRQSGIRYDRPARLHGTSKYNISRLTALALQGLISFSHVPLRLATVMGVGMGFLSLVFGFLILINRLFPTFTLFGYWVGTSPGIATLVVFLSFTLSVLFICLGIVGEYLIVLLQEAKRRPAAIIASVVGDLRPLTASYSLITAATHTLAKSVARR